MMHIRLERKTETDTWQLSSGSGTCPTSVWYRSLSKAHQALPISREAGNGRVSRARNIHHIHLADVLFCAQLHFPFYTAIWQDKFGNNEKKAAFSTFTSELLLTNHQWHLWIWIAAPRAHRFQSNLSYFLGNYKMLREDKREVEWKCRIAVLLTCTLSEKANIACHPFW